MAGELAFFELGVEDVERGRAFYEGLFGWRFAPGPSEQGFTIATPNVPGGMHGGDREARPHIFFAVDDIEAAVERVRELGGVVDDIEAAVERVRELGGVVDDMDVEGDQESVARFGRFKLCRDDQGSPFGLHQRPSS